MRFPDISIRTQLLVLVAVATVPLVLLQLSDSVTEYRESVIGGQMRALALADAAATSASQFLADAERQMTDMARVMAPELVDPATCDAATLRARSMASFATDVAVFDVRGLGVCTTHERHRHEVRDASGEAWFTAVTAKDAFVVGGLLRGWDSGEWVLPLVAPIRDAEGRTVGFLGASLALRRFQALLAGIPAREGDLITITDAHRNVLARSAEPEVWVGRKVPPQTNPETEITPNRWITFGQDFNGIDRSWGQVRLPGLEWEIFAGFDTHEVLTAARLEAAHRTVSDLLVTAFAILSAILVYGRISRALGGLVAGARSAAAGDLIELPGGGPREIEEVAHQFNQALDARHAAERSERIAKERFRSVLEHAVLGIYTSAADGRFLRVNPALVRMLGFDSPEELLGVTVTSRYVDAEVRDRLVREHAPGSVFEQVETEWLRKDGTRVTVRLSGRAVEAGDDGVVYQVVVEDVTKRKRLKEELRQTQKMEAVGRLAGGVAHDFNNILTVISGNTEFLLDEEDLPDSVRQGLAEISDAAGRAAGLTRKLLAFSRKDRPQPAVVDLNQCVQEVQRLLARLISEDVELGTCLEAEWPRVLVDPSQFEQVVMNLVINARDAIEGQGTIEIGTETRTSAPFLTESPAVAPPHAWHVVTVRDTGTGMDADTRARMFEPFFTTKGAGEGTGLGLSTVHAIVTQAGGHLSVESEPGRGTTVTSWWPAAPEAAGVDGRASEEDAGRRGRETILVVEDEAPVREIVRRVLRSAGYKVLTASDGQEGLEVARRQVEPVDLVVSDVVMPRMRGDEMAVEISRVLPGTPILFLSGHAADAQLDRLRDDGRVDLLGKPFRPGELRVRVREMLDTFPRPVEPSARSAAELART